MCVNVCVYHYRQQHADKHILYINRYDWSWQHRVPDAANALVNQVCNDDDDDDDYCNDADVDYDDADDDEDDADGDEDEDNGWDIVENGITIEKCMIVTSHNLALLFKELNLKSRLNPVLPDIIQRVCV